MEARGYDLSKPGLYYHLSELKDAGIIEVSGYVEEGRGAPEKKWKLARKKIEIDLVASLPPLWLGPVFGPRRAKTGFSLMDGGDGSVYAHG